MLATISVESLWDISALELHKRCQVIPYNHAKLDPSCIVYRGKSRKARSVTLAA